jgi:HPt (histidine-containing phosphotransfer) domain-containing protein
VPLRSTLEVPDPEITMTQHLPLVLDDARLDALVDELGDAEVVREAVQTFLDELPSRLDAIRTALDADELDLARERAHALGSPAAMLGATSVRYATKELEHAVKTGSDVDVDELYGNIEASAALTADALRDYLASPLPA